MKNQLENIDLSECEIRYSELPLLKEVLDSYDKPFQLNINQCNLEDIILAKLFEYLSKEIYITSLKLKNNHILNEETNTKLINLLLTSNINNIDLEHCLYNNSFNSFVNSLQSNNNLIILHLSYSEITDEEAKRLSCSLIENKQLEYLNLKANYISDSGAQAIANLLKHNHCLLALILYQNWIKTEGAISLAQSFQYNQCLSLLDLRYNDICEESLKSITDSLQYNYHITSLFFNKNCVDSLRKKKSTQKHYDDIKEKYIERNIRITSNYIEKLNQLTSIESKNDIIQQLKTMHYPKKIITYFKSNNEKTLSFIYKNYSADKKNILNIWKNLDRLNCNKNAMKSSLQVWWDYTALRKLGLSKKLPKILNSFGIIQTIFSFTKGESDFDLQSTSSQPNNSSHKAIKETNNEKQANPAIMGIEGKQSASMSNKFGLASFLPNNKKEQKPKLENTNSKTITPSSDKDWAIVLKKNSLGKSIWQEIFNKLTTDQPLTSKLLSIFNDATKDVAIFSITAKLQHPLDNFHKCISGDYIKEQHEQELYAEQYGYYDKISNHYYDTEEHSLNTDIYIAA